MLLIGFVSALLGLLWLLQGSDIVHLQPILCFANCEPITGKSPLWQVIGAITFATGIVIVGTSIRYVNRRNNSRWQRFQRAPSRCGSGCDGAIHIYYCFAFLAYFAVLDIIQPQRTQISQRQVWNVYRRLFFQKHRLHRFLSGAPDSQNMWCRFKPIELRPPTSKRPLAAAAGATVPIATVSMVTDAFNLRQIVYHFLK